MRLSNFRETISKFHIVHTVVNYLLMGCIKDVVHTDIITAEQIYSIVDVGAKWLCCNTQNILSDMQYQASALNLFSQCIFTECLQ